VSEGYHTRDFSGRDIIVRGVDENPKAVAAQTKRRLDLLEPEGNRVAAEALADGANKYGRQNYLTIPVHMRTYIAAMERHIDDLKSGEDFAPDSGVHHLGHVLAGGHILMAAMKNGNLVDDRGPEERSPEQEAASSAHNQPHGVKPDELPPHEVTYP
jgi:hypothetical protein